MAGLRVAAGRGVLLALALALLWRGGPERSPAPAAAPAIRRLPGSAESGRLPTAQLVGAAHPTGATALLVGGQPLRLFGVRPPSSVDKCAGTSGLTFGRPPPCLDRAQDVLAARL